MPPLAAAEADAPRVEWAPNIDGSIPASSSTSFNHLAMVLAEIAPRGLMRDTNSVLSCCRRIDVLSRYACNVFTGHKSALPGNVGKKKGSVALSWRDCFAKPRGKNDTPSVLV